MIADGGGDGTSKHSKEKASKDKRKRQIPAESATYDKDLTIERRLRDGKEKDGSGAWSSNLGSAMELEQNQFDKLEQDAAKRDVQMRLPDTGKIIFADEQ